MSNEIWPLLKSPDAAAARRWLRWHPSEIDACVAARDGSPAEPLDEGALRELREAHARWGADPASMGAIELLGSPNARVVIAGQQPGLLAGPLYTIYKALAAIRLARDLAARHPGLKFVPVFWCASEDHDFNEVRRAYWPGAQGQLDEVLVDHPDWSPGKMMGRLSTAPLAEGLIARIAGSTHETEFRAGAIEKLSQVYGGASNWEDAFCELLLWLLKGMGLVVVSPLMGWVRRRGAAILEKELEEPGASSRAVIARGEELKAAGFKPQVFRRPDAVNFFEVDGDGRRRALRAAGGKILSIEPAGDSAAEVEAESSGAASSESLLESLRERVRLAPQDFSFNVVTRPLVQDFALPTVAQVVGPGEAAYFAQVEAVYERFGVFAPVRWPRPQATLIPNNVARALEKHGLKLEAALGRGAEELARAALEGGMEDGPVGEARRMRERQLAELAAMKKSAGADPSVAGAFDKIMQAMSKGYDVIEERILYSRQRDERHLHEAMSRVANTLTPGGQVQERALNPIVPFLVNHGPDWVARLAEKMDFDYSAPPQAIYLSQL